MENWKKTRTALRTAFTKKITVIQKEIKEENPDVGQVAIWIEQLEANAVNLVELNKRIWDSMNNEDASQEDFDNEIETCLSYENRLIEYRFRTRKLLEKTEDAQKDLNSSRAGLPNEIVYRRKYKLPEIELKKFGGDPKDWLGFWGQFKKIDSDPEIAEEDKFQYLLQATIIKTKAREIVESFPPTSENYSKAIEHLKLRFGREDILVEVYIRNLLSLVLNKATNRRQNVNLAILYDQLETQLRSLDSLGIVSERYADILYPLVESCLPDEIIRTWERSKTNQANSLATCSFSKSEPNRLTFLMNFLREEVEAEERIKMSRSGFGYTPEQPKRKVTIAEDLELPSAVGLLSYNGRSSHERKTQCIFCRRAHNSSECREAKKMTLSQRIDIIKREGHCFRCLKGNHLAKVCRGKQVCARCKKRHVVIMCPIETTPSNSTVMKKEDGVNIETAEDNTLTNQNCTSSVQLQTLSVYLRGKRGRRKFRALIDTGSQKSYISEYAAKLMNYEILGSETIVHNLFGGAQSEPQIHYQYRIYMTSMDGNYLCNFETHSQRQICSYIHGFQNVSLIKELYQLGVTLTDTLCDPKFPVGEIRSDIHILIGADIAGKLLTGKVIELSCGLTAIETRLGWTVMGKVPQEIHPTNTDMNIVSMFVGDGSLSSLWELEQIGITDPIESQSRKELQQLTYEHFRKTLTVNKEKRYEITLPWLEMHNLVPNGRQIAEKRLHSTIKKLKTANILTEYQDVFHNWLQQKIIEEVYETKEPSHYLPHRAVVKASATTKIRPVFDASAHEKNMPSLNNCLEKGPNLIELIPTLLTRFRMKRFGVTADIRQAFLQISVREEDRDFLRFLWYEDGDPRRLKIYRHCRVVFGLTSSPFLLSATLAHHLESTVLDYPETAKLLKNSFYVDNCITSLEDYSRLQKFIEESQKIMLSGKFDLRDWCHNDGGMNVITNNENNSKYLDSNNDKCDYQLPRKMEPVFVLGMIWDPQADVLFYNINKVDCLEDTALTKRIILSVAQKIFDPLGILCPITLLPKLLLQECWKSKMPWDQSLSNEMYRKFTSWRNQLPQIENIKVPRWIVGKCFPSNDITLHVFADASKYAYAACAFYRIENPYNISCQLIRAKARVAPLKNVTIPRLELLACCIAARLANSIKDDIDCTTLQTYYWSDSSNALHWIKKNEQWSVFVANRVREIKRLTQVEDWNHVPGSKNPADVPSRGCSVRQLIELKWWEGPEWLNLSRNQWPKTQFIINENIVNAERRKTMVIAVNTTKEFPWYCSKFSSFLKIIRMIAWMKRFIYNGKKSNAKRLNKDLTVDEIEEAEFTLLRMIQTESFSGVKDPVVKTLMPRIDEKGIIRTQTRIIEREDSINFRYPIILPPKHPAVKLLIMSKPKEHSHAGIQILMSILRENYWILRCRKVVRLVVKSCGSCRRFKATNITTSPSPLPENRIKEAAVFEIVGLDLGGPLYSKTGEKVWFALFTCAVFRAIHIEAVTSLSTEVFLLALRRFIARRGRPKIIYSDNGTNFTGTNRAFKQINWENISKKTTVDRIRWNFIPPTAAWWGGWWERLIRMIKEILRRVLGRARLPYEELVTILCEAEGVINNRPLTYVSDDLEELSPLTPALFLRELTDDQIPEIDHLDASNFNRRYKYRIKLKDDLNKRFRTEYLGQLKHIWKNKTSSTSLYKGQVVLIGIDSQRRIQWPLARIMELYPGIDGQVRVVLVKTKNGEMLRPIQRIYPLEVEEPQGEKYRSLPNPLIPTATPIVAPEDISKLQVPRDKPANYKTRSGRTVKPPKRLINETP